MSDLHRSIERGPNSRTRVLGTVAFVALIAFGPLVFVFGDRVQTVGTPPAPVFTWDTFRRGDWAGELGKHWKESSPVTAAVRGSYNDVRHLLGIYESSRIHQGIAAWMFLPETLSVDLPRQARHAERRLQFLRDLRARCDELQVRMLVVPVPDKVRIYPDRAFADRGLPESKRGHYAMILEELRSAGLEAVDLARYLAAQREQDPDRPLYYERDSHWTPPGVWAAAERIVARMTELGWDRDLGPSVAYEAVPGPSLERISDATRMLGLRRGGAIEARLVEPFGSVQLFEPGSDGRTMLVAPAQPDATFYLAGDSFADAGLGVALAGTTGRRIDTTGAVPAEGPFAGLLQTLETIAAAPPKRRVLVWEFIERSHETYAWRRPPAVR